MVILSAHSLSPPGVPHMLSLFAQATRAVADTLREGADCGCDSFSFWSGLASIVGLVLTVVGLYLAFKGHKAQEAGEQALADAENLRNLYTRKQRLPEYRDELDSLATRLDAALNDFKAMHAEAQEVTRLIIRTVKHLSEHLDGDQLLVVTGLAEQIEHRSGLINLRSGQEVKSCTREIVLNLKLVIDDERAKSL